MPFNFMNGAEIIFRVFQSSFILKSFIFIYVLGLKFKKFELDFETETTQIE